MKKHFLFLALFVFMACIGFAQQPDLKALRKMKPTEEYENIHKQLLYSDTQATSVLLWIKKGVKLHRHNEHTEHVYVLRGKAEMQLGEENLKIKKGDLIMIPQGTAHAVKVTGGVLKVVSIQAPEFSGKDREWLEK